MFGHSIAVPFRRADDGDTKFGGSFQVNIFQSGTYAGNKFKISGFLDEVPVHWDATADDDPFIRLNNIQKLDISAAEVIINNKTLFRKLLFDQRMIFVKLQYSH